MSEPAKIPNIDPDKFGYLQLQIHKDEPWRGDNETPKEKMFRKFGENPFVPIGLAVTVFALVNGMRQMRTGNSLKSQKMMRLRVAAQGFTVLALCVGVGVTAYKKKREREEKAKLLK